MTGDTAAQVVDNTSALRTLETFGAGLIALLFIFGMLWIFLKEGVPAVKAMAASFITAIDKMSVTLTQLDKTMELTQEASVAAIAAIDKRVQHMELRLESHIEAFSRIESQVSCVSTNTTEIKERVRNCGIARDRDSSSRTRKGE